jgi:aspartyl protease family protein
MTTDDLPYMIYLLLLLLFVGGGTLLAFRGQLGRMLKQASVWALIFAAAVVGYGLFDDQRNRSFVSQSFFTDEGRVEIPRGPDGHYRVVMGVNGVPVEFVIDTGASQLVLTERDARRTGIDISGLAFTGRAATANGLVKTAPVTLDEIQLGGISDRNISAVVNGGDMDQSLLGMSYLESFGRIEISGGRLILERG